MTTYRLRDVALVLTSNVDKVVYPDESPVRLCNYVDVYKNNFIHNDMPFSEGSASKAEISKFRVCVDDVIITKDSESSEDIGVPALVKSTSDDLVCGYHLSILRANNRRMIGPFLYWHLLSKKSREDFGNAANGVTRYGLTLGGIKGIPIHVPDLPTQRAIADFLDRETARIDLLIEKKQRLVALLEEKRSATVTAAVTGKIKVEGVGNRDCLLAEGGGEVIFDQSLNEARLASLARRSNVGPVGLLWVRGAPASWVVTTLQRLFTVSSGDFLSPDDLRDDGFPVFGGNGHRGYFSDYNCNANTMLIGRYGALCGNVHIPEERFWATEHAFRVRPLIKYHQRFMAFYVEALELRYLAARAAQPGLNSRMVREQAIALPDLPTQRAIADFLDRETARLQQIQGTTQQSIDRLKEYRSALITAAVTGQIDVAKWGKSGANERQLNSLQVEMEH